MSYFRLEERNTNVRTEVLAGCTTFLTMVYIIFVNPLVLAGTGMGRPDRGRARHRDAFHLFDRHRHRPRVHLLRGHQGAGRAPPRAEPGGGYGGGAVRDPLCGQLKLGLGGADGRCRRGQVEAAEGGDSRISRWLPVLNAIRHSLPMNSCCTCIPFPSNLTRHGGIRLFCGSDRRAKRRGRGSLRHHWKAR